MNPHMSIHLHIIALSIVDTRAGVHAPIYGCMYVSRCDI